MSNEQVEMILDELDDYGEVMIFDEEMVELPVGLQMLIMLIAQRSCQTVFARYDYVQCATVISCAR